MPIKKVRLSALPLPLACLPLLVAMSVAALAQAPQPAAGRPAAQAAPAPKPVRTEIRNIGNWKVTCEQFAGKAARPVCTAILKIVEPKNNRTLFVWILARQAKTGQIVGLIQTPTGVLIENGLTFNFAPNSVRRFSYTSCETGRCSTIVPLGLALRKEIGRAKKGRISIVSTNGRQINFEIEPAGFAEAYASVLAVK